MTKTTVTEIHEPKIGEARIVSGNACAAVTFFGTDKNVRRELTIEEIDRFIVLFHAVRLALNPALVPQLIAFSKKVGDDLH